MCDRVADKKELAKKWAEALTDGANKQQPLGNRYDGEDGLIIFGHKPVPEPAVRRDCVGRPIAVNVDTGCIYGGHLSAYDVDADELLQVRSQQPIDKQHLEFAVSPTVAPSELPTAWDDPSRTSVG